MFNAELASWLETNRINYLPLSEFHFSIDDKIYIIVNEKEGAIVDKNFELLIDQQDVDNQDKIEGEIEAFVFKFGTKWYYAEDDENITLEELRYKGTEKDIVETFPILGVHGGFDLMNGSRAYKDWCKKAKFCNVDTLAICEENTLAGTLEFQNACEKANINSIIGETITVRGANDVGYSIKLYVTNTIGWKNLLMINAFINVHNDERFISEEQLRSHYEGLICILTPDCKLKDVFIYYTSLPFVDLFYQIDVVQWDSSQRDEEWLKNIQSYIINDKYRRWIRPIIIADMYYLEKEHASLKKELNAIGKVAFKNQSADQYFKTPTEQLAQLIDLFEECDEQQSIDFIYEAIDNARKIGDISFKIETGKLHLPSYKMTEKEKDQYESKDDLLWDLLERGLEKKGITEKDNLDEYVQRIKTEMDVICDAKLQDYFLITWDILNWAHDNDIATGWGRGSAAGSMVAYLLEIVHVDPFQYGLLFERFLNEGRLYKYKKVQGYSAILEDKRMVESIDPLIPGVSTIDGSMVHECIEAEITIKVTGSMPDIDNDIAGSKRDQLKRHIEQRYGADHVSGIGTYSALKIKSAINSLGKRSGLAPQTTQYITGAISDDSLSYAGLFKYGLEKAQVVKTFIEHNPELIEKIPAILNQPNIPSVHAGGVVIVPEGPNGIYDQLPVKKMDGILVSEWEMDYVEQAGFLKMDILGLKQLDKFQEIIQLIKTQKGKDISLAEIPLDDPKVYEYFAKGFNEDVFQFGGYGLKSYTRDLKPEVIEDLIATSALYRPGPIEMKAHTEYVNRKNGGTVSFPWGTKEILKDTYGLLTYQEQVQKIVIHVAGFSPNEADDVRKAIGKKLPELMAKYKGRFIEGAVSNGCPQREAAQMWDDIEGFGSYSFNKSHATCYSIMGYFCQWLKVHYPLEFWLVTLKYSSQEQIVNRLAEMSLIGGMEVGGPNINYSTDLFTTDNKKIFWSLQSVKQVGEKALSAILEERKNGPFYSVTEFAQRLKKTAVNKLTVVNLILTGAFDEQYKIDNEKSIRLRFSILTEYLTFIVAKHDDIIAKMRDWENFQWILKQRELCGLGMIDVKTLLKKVGCEETYGHHRKYKFFPIAEVLNRPEKDFIKQGPIIGGVITKVTVKKAAKERVGEDGNAIPNEPFAIIEISDGVSTLSGKMWSTQYKQHKDILQINDLLFLKDVWIKYDKTWRKSNEFIVQATTIIKTINQITINE